jgi:DNA end-binding protein Ku
MAKQVIDSLSTDFDPASYKDQHRAQLLALIERKAAGEEIVSNQAEAPKPTKAPDLMAALEESLAAIKSDELSGGAKRKKPKAQPKPKAKSKSKARAAK